MKTKKLIARHRRRAIARRSRRLAAERTGIGIGGSTSEDFDRPRRLSPEAAWDEELPVD